MTLMPRTRAACCARSERPRSRPAEQRYEGASPHRGTPGPQAPAGAFSVPGGFPARNVLILSDLHLNLRPA